MLTKRKITRLLAMSQGPLEVLGCLRGMRSSFHSYVRTREKDAMVSTSQFQTPYTFGHMHIGGKAQPKFELALLYTGSD